MYHQMKMTSIFLIFLIIQPEVIKLKITEIEKLLHFENIYKYFGIRTKSQQHTVFELS